MPARLPRLPRRFPAALRLGAFAATVAVALTTAFAQPMHGAFDPLASPARVFPAAGSTQGERAGTDNSGAAAPVTRVAGRSPTAR